MLKKFLDYVGIVLIVTFIAGICFIINIPSTEQKAYQADCIRLRELRQEYFELKSSEYFNNSSRVEELREEIHTLERRCKGY